MTTNTNHLTISWSISKGRDTYGYNICRLDSYISGKRYRCMGGGYDMMGTVVGDFIQAEHQDKLQAHGNISDFYGARKREDGSISLDGACGLECMLSIAAAIGLTFKRLHNRKGHTVGYLVDSDSV